MNGRVTYDGVFLNGNISLNKDMKLEEIEVSENGVYTPSVGYDGISKAIVDVEANVESLTVNSNGTYTPPSGVDGFDSVVVNVPQTIPILDTLNVNTNGTYTPPSGVDGYDNVVVNVPLPENAYLLKEYEDVPTDIASFTASDAPLKSLTTSIVPVQAGSGDPSPTNVRPISGWSAVDVSVVGVNNFDKTTIIQKAYIDNSTGALVNSVASWSDVLNASDWISVTPNTAYYHNTGGQSSSNYLAWYDLNKNYIIGQGSHPSSIITSPSNAYFLRITIHNDYVNSCSVNYPSTDTSYHAYNGTTTTIPFTDGQGQSVEVFGGSVDVINGVVTPCPYYTSYNGEQLTGEWISDRDVYSPNTSPTIGAQVVNIGATDTPFNVQSTSIKSLDGVNNVFASTGDVEELKYFTRATS